MAMTSPELVQQKHVFHALKVARVIPETADACSLVFEIPAPLREVFRYRAGQFLTLEVPYEGVMLRRCYSLASSPDTDAEHKISIKRVAFGRVSNWVNDHVPVGTTLRVMPPDGRFTLRCEADHMLLFAGGSGITPVISIIKTALATTSRTVSLVYANRSANSVIFAAELSELAARYVGRLRVTQRYDNVDGFLRIGDIGRLIGGRVDGEYFLCGPQGFMQTVESGLRAAGVPSERLHIERFTSPADERAAGEATPGLQAGDVPAMVRVELKGKAHDVPYVRGRTLLRTALDAGLDAPYSCEEGFCGSCTARLLAGQVEMTEDDALTPDEKKRGYVLACQARPTSRTCTIRFLDC